MLRDLRYSVRMLALRPLPAVLTVGLLSIGISASVLTFCLADAVIWNPTSFRDPERLVRIRSWTPSGGMNFTVHAAALDRWSAREQIISAVHVWSLMPAVIGGDERAEAVTLGRFTPGLLSELGVAVRGRDFLPSDIGANVVILSDEAWRSQFDRAPDVIGRQLLIEGRPHRVIGVAPRGFGFPVSRVRAWLPPEANAQRVIVTAVARLRPDVAFGDAARFTAASTSGFPEGGVPEIRLSPLIEINRQTKQALVVGLLAALCLLLIAVANAGNLLLADTVARSTELAVRRSLGATPFALARQIVVDAGLKAAIAGACALIVVWLSIEVITTGLPYAMTWQSLRPVALDWRAFGAAVAVSLAAAFGAVIAPCANLARPNLQAMLQSANATVRTRWRDALTIGQLVATLVLLAGAALLANGFVRLIRLDQGFDVKGLTVVELSLLKRDFDDRTATASRLGALRGEARMLAGVEAATTADGIPSSLSFAGAGAIEGPGGVRLAESSLPVSFAFVDDDYFSTLRIPLVAGRFPDAGAGSSGESPAVVTSSLAQHLWPGREPMGERFRLDSGDPWLTVVGVTGDVGLGGFDSPQGSFGVFIGRTPAHPMARYEVLVVRSNAPTRSLEPQLRSLVGRLLPGTAIYSIRSLESMIGDSSARVRFVTELMTSVALVALAIAAVGVYGAFWCAVNQRRREIGVRLAIGAAPRNIIAMVLAESLRLVGFALAIGLPLALATSSAIRPLLFDVSPFDPGTMAAAAGLLTACVAAAAYLPARWASAVDPAETLRAQ